MTPSAPESETSKAWVMVGVQALLFLLVAVSALLPALGPALPTPLPVALALVLLGAAGVVASGRDLGEALTPLPIPNGKGMAAKGLYRWARHPMYSSLVMICLGVAVGAGTLQTYAAVVLLAVFFAIKARTEEKYLLSVYDGYLAYAAATGRFVPMLGRLSTRGGAP